MEQSFRSNDVLITGGTVIDGTGRPALRADVLVRDDRVVAVGSGLDGAATVLEADGCVVAPGFVDLHTHSDLAVLVEPGAENRIRQGITTDVAGNCGFSAVPAGHGDVFEELLASVGPTLPIDWSDLDGYERRLAQAGPAINVGLLVGHGALRAMTAGLDDRPLTEKELSAMRRTLADLLAQGALGLSTGLTYVPSMFAPAAEVHALAAVVHRFGALYASHARAGAGRTRAAVEETIAVAAATGARVQHSHLAINEPAAWGTAPELLALFDDAAATGLDVGFDVYPYAASASALTQYLPSWLMTDGHDGLRRRLADPQVRRRAEQELAGGWYGGIPWLWERVTVAASPSQPGAVGRTLADLAGDRERPPEALVLDLCDSDGAEAQVVLAYRSEDDVATFLEHPLGVLASDGLVQPARPAGRPHPRSFGAQARFLARHAVNLPDAVRRLTSAPADRAGLGDRGRLAPGMAADVVVFSPDRIRDRATFDDPAATATGVEHVIVNGTPVLAYDAVTGERPGRLLRRDEE